MSQNHVRKVFTNPIHFFAFGFGSGLAPKMPGTIGTLVGIPIYILMHNINLNLYITITLILTIFGFWVCDYSAKDLGIHDYPGIVWDEIVGYLWTMAAIPFTWYWVILGFIAFRFFDILKPWPIGWFDRHVKGGVGIMVDDLLAALYAWIFLQIVLYFWH